MRSAGVNTQFEEMIVETVTVMGLIHASRKWRGVKPPNGKASRTTRPVHVSRPAPIQAARSRWLR
jgi:hypothetical protein